jgi:hypothetical protein
MLRSQRNQSLEAWASVPARVHKKLRTAHLMVRIEMLMGQLKIQMLKPFTIMSIIIHILLL